MQYKKVRDNQSTTFMPWQPSTWPPAPKDWNREIEQILRRILTETISPNPKITQAVRRWSMDA